ncbi:MAG: HEAT repeat domain-containing protein [Planctomycetes bacterium]|nr:HEAT repeat domain-containing protein [Planctomycetota bacterium]
MRAACPWVVVGAVALLPVAWGVACEPDGQPRAHARAPATPPSLPAAPAPADPASGEADAADRLWREAARLGDHARLATAAADVERACEALPPGVIESLRGDETPARRWAAWLAGRMGQRAKNALGELFLLAGRAEGVERIHALEAIELIGPADAGMLPQIIDALGDDDDAIRYRAALVVGRMGPEGAAAATTLAGLLRDPNPVVRDRAFWAVGEMGPAASAALPALFSALRGKQRVDWACWVLLRVGAPAAPGLVELLSDGDVEVRHSTAWVLAGMGSAGAVAVPALGARLRDPGESEEVRYLATVALGRMGAVEPAAIALLTDAMLDEVVCHWAAHALRETGESALPHLAQALATRSPLLRRWVAYVLYTMGPAAAGAGGVAVTALIAALDDEDPDLRSRAAAALSEIGPAAAPAAGALARLLARRGEPGRVFAALALGRIGPAARAPALPALSAASEDPDETVAVWARWATARVEKR